MKKYGKFISRDIKLIMLEHAQTCLNLIIPDILQCRGQNCNHYCILLALKPGFVNLIKTFGNAMQLIEFLDVS